HVEAARSVRREANRGRVEVEEVAADHEVAAVLENGHVVDVAVCVSGRRRGQGRGALVVRVQGEELGRAAVHGAARARGLGGGPGTASKRPERYEQNPGDPPATRPHLQDSKRFVDALGTAG